MGIEGIKEFWMGQGNFKITAAVGEGTLFELDKQWSVPFQLGLGAASALLFRVFAGKHLTNAVFITTALVNLPAKKQEAWDPLKKTNTYSLLRGLQIGAGALSFLGGGLRSIEGIGLQLLGLSAPLHLSVETIAERKGASVEPLKKLWVQDWLGLPKFEGRRTPDLFNAPPQPSGSGLSSEDDVGSRSDRTPPHSPLAPAHGGSDDDSGSPAMYAVPLDRSTASVPEFSRNDEP